MRNTKERVDAVVKQTHLLAEKKQRQKTLIIGVFSVAACFIIILSLAFAMPNIIERLSNESFSHHGLSASIFDTNGRLGYLIIGLLAFSLGVSVTILSYRINLRSKKQEEEKKNGRADC